MEKEVLTFGGAFKMVADFSAARKLQETPQQALERMIEEADELTLALKHEDKREMVLEAMDTWRLALTCQNLIGGSLNGLTHVPIVEFQNERAKGSVPSIVNAYDRVVHRALMLENTPLDNLQEVNKGVDRLTVEVVDLANACGYGVEDAFLAKHRRTSEYKYPIAAVMALTGGMRSATQADMRLIAEQYDVSLDVALLDIKPLTV
jgi:NTP pyrophosphatase (non-canonical NTP hydrolase)